MGSKIQTPPGAEPVEEYEYDHTVTYRNTVKHWVLYTLDALESEHEPESKADGENSIRSRGASPKDIYEFAAGDESIVFKSKSEIGRVLSSMGCSGSPFTDESRPVNRRCEASEWEGADVKYLYRMNEFGRNVLLDLGVPDKLPNRRDFDANDRSLGVKPGHHPGWWRDSPDYEHYTDEWDVSDNDWIETDHDRVYAKEEADHKLIENRNYVELGTEIAEAFPDVTFVLTCGPYRQHDLMYAIRDPWRKVVQIDIYSPMALHREEGEIARRIRNLVSELHKGLRTVEDEYSE